MSDRVLVAGIGNIFLSDDGFGVEVANRLRSRELPENVRVEDFGIRGVHLAYELLEGYRAALLVDAIDMREAPGTIAVIEPEPPAAVGDDESPSPIDAHTMTPDLVLGTLAQLGGCLDRILVVGCQPESLDEGIGLSESVAQKVDGAVELCCELIIELVLSQRKEVST
ncbi:MAG: hydrogenase maturation protease [Acidimicrobiales bacterium]